MLLPLAGRELDLRKSLGSGGNRTIDEVAPTRNLVSAYITWMILLSSYSAVSRHAPADVFARWADPMTWPQWDSEVRSVDFDGPAVVGAVGKLCPRSGPSSSFSITALVPNRVFTNTGRLPGAHLIFEHVVDPRADGSEVTVTVSLDGPLAAVWKIPLRRPMADAARLSTQGLITTLDGA